MKTFSVGMLFYFQMRDVCSIRREKSHDMISMGLAAPLLSVKVGVV